MTFRSFFFGVLLALGLSSSTSALAQLAPPNDLGVALGHIHLLVKDAEAQRQFWTTMMGGTLVTNGPLSMIEFPGIFIMLRQGEPAGPPAGSIIDHFGFALKDLPAARARWKAGNVVYEEGATNPNQGYVLAPDGIRVEVFGDPSLPGPISMDHIHTYPMEPDIPAMQAWYAKVFGGLPGKRQRVAAPGLIDCDYFHRFNLSFSPRDGKLAPTRGRAIDHIGFDVKNIDEFARRLEAQGIKFDAPPRQIPNSPTRVAFLTDPWGTYIEVTEKLAPAATPPQISPAARADLAPAGKLRVGLNLGNPFYVNIDPAILLAYAERLPGSRVLDGRIMTGQLAIGPPNGRPAGSEYISEFNEDVKASGMVARAIAKHGVRGVFVAP